MRPPTIRDRAYESYRKYCARIGVTPQEQEHYEATVAKVTDASVSFGFHVSASDTRGTSKQSKATG